MEKKSIVPVGKTTKMKIYPCCKCTRMYKTIRNLWDHLRSKHYISVTFKCTHCYKWFRNHRLVKKHLRAACLTKKSDLMPNNEEQSNTVIAEKSKIKSIIDPESIHDLENKLDFNYGFDMLMDYGFKYGLYDTDNISEAALMAGNYEVDKISEHHYSCVRNTLDFDLNFDNSCNYFGFDEQERSIADNYDLIWCWILTPTVS